MTWLDHWVAAILVPLACWILLSGLDDFFISAVFLLTGRKRFPWPSPSELDQCPERRIAILVPLWQEHGVIGRMLEHNLSVIKYHNYDVFVGVYPNDEPTLRAVSDAAARHPRIHMAVCPHNGPTSKGDCLNNVYRSLEQHEARHGLRFDVIMTHDAEDLVHPESLPLINWFSRQYDMVQVPVLALPTPLGQFTHGLYCDEFAEYQTKDIPVRQRLGGFLPANGVGTGFERAALERLAATRGGRVFDPDCLTEDYENGYCLHALGCPQIFVPLRFDAAGPVATREYFPRRVGAAVRQRSRWVAGIALQGWQRHGWRGPWRQVYWFWRDRKGLVGNLISPLANLVLAYGMATYFRALHTGSPWHLGSLISPWVSRSCEVTLWITLFQAGLRVYTSARIYGWCFAVAAPVRVFWGNVVNFAATVKALRQFVEARLRRRNLAWAKTEHVYLPQGSRVPGRPRLGEVLVEMRCLTEGQLEDALCACPPGTRLGEYLVQSRRIYEDQLYQALSSQTGIPLGLPDRRELSRTATRTIPAETARRWKVLPYRLALGQLHVITSDLPSAQMAQDLTGFSGLEIRFRLVRRSEFDALAEEFLAPAPSPVRPVTEEFELQSIVGPNPSLVLRLPLAI